jgi:hypothetical protein
MIETDLTLTPENAEERGYEWVQDVIYDPEAPKGVMQDIEKLIKAKTHKLGSPASEQEKELFSGLYLKIENK